MKIFRHVTIDGLDELETKTINGSRHYIVEDGKYYPSVTTVLGKNPATTVVVIDEVETDNWGIGGELVTERRKRGA